MSNLSNPDYTLTFKLVYFRSEGHGFKAVKTEEVIRRFRLNNDTLKRHEREPQACEKARQIITSTLKEADEKAGITPETNDKRIDFRDVRLTRVVIDPEDDIFSGSEELFKRWVEESSDEYDPTG